MQENLMKALDCQRHRKLAPYPLSTREKDDPIVQNKKFQLPGNKIAYLSHGQGIRFTQEDTADIAIYESSKFHDINHLTEMFFESIIDLQTEINNAVVTRMYQSSGATFNASLQVSGNVITANVGDSRAILIERNNPTLPFAARALSWDHKPNDTLEKSRIEKMGGFVSSDNRLQGRLALSRALGDVVFDAYGISHEPDLTTIKINNTQEAYIINCCDGVTDVMRETEIIGFFNNIDIKDNPANLLRREAYMRGSSDNITVCFTPVIFNTNNAILSYVADGHGGDQVSHFIYEQYKNILKHKINS